MVQAIEQRVAMQAAVKTENEPQMRDVLHEDRLNAIMALFHRVSSATDNLIQEAAPTRRAVGKVRARADHVASYPMAET
jgi:hypothetical protein